MHHSCIENSENIGKIECEKLHVDGRLAYQRA